MHGPPHQPPGAWQDKEPDRRTDHGVCEDDPSGLIEFLETVE
jgi:hypothetical protein